MSIAWRARVLLGAMGLSAMAAAGCGPSARPMTADASPDTQPAGLPDGLRWDGLGPDVRAPDLAPGDPWASSSVTITYQRSVSLTFVTLKGKYAEMRDLAYVGSDLYVLLISEKDGWDEVAKIDLKAGKAVSQFVCDAAVEEGLASDGTYFFFDRVSEYARHQLGGAFVDTLPSLLESEGGGMEVAEHTLYQVGGGGKTPGLYGVDLTSKKASVILAPEATLSALLAISPRTFIIGLSDHGMALTLHIYDRAGTRLATRSITKPFDELSGLEFANVTGMAWNGTELVLADSGLKKIHFYAVH